MSGPEAAFWDLYDKDEKGCEVVYVNSLLARIAELEAENKRLRTRVTATEDDRNQRLDEMRAALAKQSLHVEDCHRQVEQAEAALAEQMKWLRKVDAEYVASQPGPTRCERYLAALHTRLADLKARAEEGSDS